MVLALTAIHALEHAPLGSSIVTKDGHKFLAFREVGSIILELAAIA